MIRLIVLPALAILLAVAAIIAVVRWATSDLPRNCGHWGYERSVGSRILKVDVLGRLSLSRSAVEITLGQLATHTSDLPRLPSDIQAGGDKRNPYAHYTRSLLLTSLGEIEVLRSSVPRYSNYGVGLLGEVLAIHAGTTYGKLIAERVLSPLGLESASTWTDGIDEPECLADRTWPLSQAARSDTSWRGSDASAHMR